LPYSRIEDRRAAVTRHYHRNPRKVIAWNLARRGKYRTLVQEYKRAKGCAKCGLREPVCLDFHHVRGKKEALISALLNSGFGWERIYAEMVKCEILCANCHRLLHWRATHPASPSSRVNARRSSSAR